MHRKSCDAATANRMPCIFCLGHRQRNSAGCLIAPATSDGDIKTYVCSASVTASEACLECLGKLWLQRQLGCIRLPSRKQALTTEPHKYLMLQRVCNTLVAAALLPSLSSAARLCICIPKESKRFVDKHKQERKVFKMFCLKCF